MIFEQIVTGGCLSYLMGCEERRAAILIDPHLNQIDRYLGLAAATLRELGYTKAAALDGGIKAWRESGLPMTAL